MRRWGVTPYGDYQGGGPYVLFPHHLVVIKFLLHWLSPLQNDKVSRLSFPATGPPDPGRVSEGSLKGSLKGFRRVLEGFDPFRNPSETLRGSGGSWKWKSWTKWLKLIETYRNWLTRTEMVAIPAAIYRSGQLPGPESAPRSAFWVLSGSPPKSAFRVPLECLLLSLVSMGHSEPGAQKHSKKHSAGHFPARPGHSCRWRPGSQWNGLKVLGRHACRTKLPPKNF